MERIEKKQEPQAWTAHRTTPGADYQAIPELKEALLAETGFVCAYCGRRIPCDDHRPDKMHIEHIVPRESLLTPAERMDYSNLVACCPGYIGDCGWGNVEPSLHCDARKGSRKLSFNLTDDTFPSITYNTNVKSDIGGAMLCHDETIQNQIGPTEAFNHPDNILNLNHPILRANRIAVIKAIQTMARRPGNGNKKGWWQKQLRVFSTKTSVAIYNEKTYAAYHPYRSIAIFYITRRLKQFDN